jgi:hypothetical protein
MVILVSENYIETENISNHIKNDELLCPLFCYYYLNYL